MACVEGSEIVIKLGDKSLDVLERLTAALEGQDREQLTRIENLLGDYNSELDTVESKLDAIQDSVDPGPTEHEPSGKRISVYLYENNTWRVNHGGPQITREQAERAMVAIASAAVGVDPQWQDRERINAAVACMLARRDGE